MTQLHPTTPPIVARVAPAPRSVFVMAMPELAPTFPAKSRYLEWAWPRFSPAKVAAVRQARLGRVAADAGAQASPLPLVFAARDAARKRLGVALGSASHQLAELRDLLDDGRARRAVVGGAAGPDGMIDQQPHVVSGGDAVCPQIGADVGAERADPGFEGDDPDVSLGEAVDDVSFEGRVVAHLVMLTRVVCDLAREVRK